MSKQQHNPRAKKTVSLVVRANFNIPRELLAEVQAAATRAGLAFQAWVVDACKEKLARCKSAAD